MSEHPATIVLGKASVFKEMAFCYFFNLLLFFFFYSSQWGSFNKWVRFHL